MPRRCYLAVAVLLLVAAVSLQARTLATGCDAVDGRSVSTFAAKMSAAPGLAHLFTGQAVAPVPVFAPGTGAKIIAPLGCSANDCRVCNANGLACTPVPGDCCCV